jgi:hypothetical protein
MLCNIFQYQSCWKRRSVTGENESDDEAENGLVTEEYYSVDPFFETSCSSAQHLKLTLAVLSLI